MYKLYIKRKEMIYLSLTENSALNYNLLNIVVHSGP